MMRSLNSLRVPIATTAALTLFSAAYAFIPSFGELPPRYPNAWPDVLLLGFAATYIAFTICLCLASSLSTLLNTERIVGEASMRSSFSQHRSRHSLLAHTCAETRVGVKCALGGRWTIPVALGLAVLVGIEALAHAGTRSPYWFTGTPRFDSDTSTAEGHVTWLDGHPLQSDSAAFIIDTALFSGTSVRDQLPSSGTVGIPGRSVYPFLAMLFVRALGPFVGTYVAFVALNWLCWWLGALAMFDLGRRAAGSPWAGALAAVLTATGLGFTFMVGSAVSNSAAYGLTAVLIWLYDRIRLDRQGTSWKELLALASVTAAVGLTYSLAPLFLFFAICVFVGRVDLGRLLLWVGTVLLVGEGWIALVVAGINVPFFQSMSATRPLTVCATAATLIVMSVVPRRIRERGVALACLLAASVVALFVGNWSTVGSHLFAVGAAGLQVPHYLTDTINRVLLQSEVSTLSWRDFQRSLLLYSFTEKHFLRAFPAVVWVPALAGVVLLPMRWREWSVALFVGTALIALAMFQVSGTPHPRLAYLAYPSLYLLASYTVFVSATRVRNLLVQLGLSTGHRHTAASAFVIGATLLWVGAAAWHGNASLFDQWSFAYAFHGSD